MVYCSRSGPPSQPWLEPDVNDRLEELAAEGVTDVVVAPIGFVSDHMEVRFDLDTEAAETAERVGLRMVRVPTVGTDDEFVSGLVDLALERAGQARGEEVPDPGVAGERRAAGGVPARVLPQPARGQAGAVRVGLMPATPGAAELAELEQLAVDAATEAGRFILEDRPAELGVAKTKSSATDVVTVMDQQAEQLLRRRITAARPHDAIVGEEAAAKDGSSGVTWLIDPIDGTVNYLYDIPAYCVSVAAVTGDASTAGGVAACGGGRVQPEHR